MNSPKAPEFNGERWYQNESEIGPREMAEYCGKRWGQTFWRDWKEEGVKWFPKGVESIAEIAAGMARVNLFTCWVGFGNDGKPGKEYEEIAAQAAREWVENMIEATTPMGGTNEHGRTHPNRKNNS